MGVTDLRARWIVGVDGSAESNTALDWALRQSDGRDVDVVAIHVDHVPAPSRLLAAVTGRDHDDAEHRASARRELEAALEDITAGRPVDHRVLEGSPGRSLVTAAADASLLVVGRHGTGGLRHALGSVSRYCATHASVPTVVVPTTWTPGPIERVVVGFDGSEHAGDAVRWAADFVDPGVELRSLIAIEIAPWLQEDIVHVRLGEDVQAEERRLLESLATVDPEGRTRPDVVVRGARPALARAAETADLVVVGAHGAGRIGTTVLGSVSTWMLDGSPIPVVVVPSPSPEAAHEKGTE